MDSLVLKPTESTQNDVFVAPVAATIYTLSIFINKYILHHKTRHAVLSYLGPQCHPLLSQCPLPTLSASCNPAEIGECQNLPVQWRSWNWQSYWSCSATRKTILLKRERKMHFEHWLTKKKKCFFKTTQQKLNIF